MYLFEEKGILRGEVDIVVYLELGRVGEGSESCTFDDVMDNWVADLCVCIGREGGS